MSKKLQATVDAFLVQYYRWAMEETREELLGDLPRVRRINGSLAQQYVRFIAGLKPSSVFPAAAALVKRYHKRALELSGETLSQEDREWVDAFLNFEKPFAPTWDPAIAEEKYRAVVNSAKGPQLDKRKLVRELRTRLSPVFGSEGEAFGTQVRRYTASRGPLVLQTYVDWGGRLPLRYSHSVVGKDMQRITHDISLLAWLGVSSDTSWSLLVDEDIVPAAELVAELCAHFKAAFLHFDLTRPAS